MPPHRKYGSPCVVSTLHWYSVFILSLSSFLLSAFPSPSSLPPSHLPSSLSHSSPLLHFSLPQAQKAKLIAEGKLLGPKLAGAAAIAKKDENVEYEPFQFEDGAYEMAGEEGERGCLSIHSERKMMCF